MLILTNREYDKTNDTFTCCFNAVAANCLTSGSWDEDGPFLFLEATTDMQAHAKTVMHFCEVAARHGKDVLFHIHGFNNTFDDAVERSRALETLYGVEVVLFTW